MSRKPKLPPLSDAQLEIMQCIWDGGEVTVTDVWQQLSDEREIARNTVLTVMDRLTKRGWLSKKPVGNTYLYRANLGRERALGNVVERLVETAFSGAADRLVMALLDGRGVSAEEAARIRQLIDASRSRKTQKRE